MAVLGAHPFPSIFKKIEDDPPQTAEAFADVLFLCSGIKKEKNMEKWRDVCSRVAKYFHPDYHPQVWYGRDIRRSPH